MSKKKPVKEHRSREEVLDSVVDAFLEKGEPLSTRAARKNPFLNYKEIMEVLGQRNGWAGVVEAAALVLYKQTHEEIWGNYIPGAKKAELDAVWQPKTETETTDVLAEVNDASDDEAMIDPQQTESASPQVSGKLGRKPRYSRQELIDLVLKAEAQLGRLPGVADLSDLRAKGIELPSWPTLTSYLGSKKTWPSVLHPEQQ